MMRPGFRPSAEAPTTTALFGVEQPPQLGDRARRRQGLRPVQPREAVERDEAAVLRRHHRVHLELREAEAVRRKEPGPPLRQAGEGHGQRGQPLLREPRAAARPKTAGERCVHERPAQRPQRVARREAAGRHHGARLLGTQGAEEGLGVEAAHPEDHHRAEGGVVAEGGQHLAPGAGAEAHPLDDEHAVETRPGGSGAGRGQHARRPPRAAASGSLRHTTTPPTSLLWRRSGEAILTTASSEPRPAHSEASIAPGDGDQAVAGHVDPRRGQQRVDLVLEEDRPALRLRGQKNGRGGRARPGRVRSRHRR